MIKKVEGYNAWVLPLSEVKTFLQVQGYSLKLIPHLRLFYYDLPLFDIKLHSNFRYKEEDLNKIVLVINQEGLTDLHKTYESEDFVKKVNERWNEFFDDSKNNQNN